MNEKVFVVLIEWSIDYEQDARVIVCKTKEKAQEEMRTDYENFIKEFDNYDECSIGDTHASASIEGDWSANHCSWQIKEEEVYA